MPHSIPSVWVFALQRLFSAFPDSWPGLGLFLLRVALGLRLIYLETPSLWGKPLEPTAFVQSLIGDAGAVLLLAGLWTPIAGTLVALDEVWIVLSSYSSHREEMVLPIFLGVVSVSLAMLGPGAWSVDARLFGRKRYDVRPTER